MGRLGSAIVSKVGVPVASFVGALSETKMNVIPKVKLCFLLVLIPAIPALLLHYRKNIAQIPSLYRVLWVASFLINMLAGSVPGRLESLQGGVPWESFFQPSAWAFSLWGVIYASELISVLHVGLSGEPTNALRKAVPFWVAGNLFQALWCAAFRPAFINVLWLPTALLALAGSSFALAHLELTSSIRYLSSAFNAEAQRHLYLVRFPLALHSAWLAAATLLNFNSWLAVSKISTDSQLASSFLSAYGAATIGAVFTWKTRDPFIAFTIAWALAALSDRTREKSAVALVIEGKGLNKKGLFGRAQGALATTEKILSFVMLAFGVGAAVPNDLF
eukprot:gene23679-26795_t